MTGNGHEAALARTEVIGNNLEAKPLDDRKGLCILDDAARYEDRCSLALLIQGRPSGISHQSL